MPLLAGPDERSVFLRGSNGEWTPLDADLTPKGAPLSAPTPCYRTAARGDRLAFVLDREIRILGTDGRTVSTIEFEGPNELGTIAFDASGATLWMVVGTSGDYVLVALDVETGHIARREVDIYTEAIWLLPDWNAPRSVLIGSHDDSSSTRVSVHSVDGEIRREPWTAIEWFGSRHACPVHYSGGRLVVAGKKNLAVFPTALSQAEVGPRSPDSRVIEPLLSTRERFLIETDNAIRVYDAMTLREIGEVPCTPNRHGRLGVQVILLADNRAAVAKRSAVRILREDRWRIDPAWYDEPTVIELWQL